MTFQRTWDIFCTVVDNYGDIGVCWRLARQLSTEHGQRIRLWVNDLASFVRINSEIDPDANVQSNQGVEVRRWCTPFPDADLALGVADVVVEAFACELPARYRSAMAQRRTRPVWINLEYLSAENWVRGCHGLPSPHPQLPLVKYFFFPGFFAGTGGLLVERGLRDRLGRFRHDREAQAAFWRDMGIAATSPGVLRISLFAYEHPAIPDLLDAWSHSGQDVLCLIPEGGAAALACAHLGTPDHGPGAVATKGSLEIRVLPFVDQDRYDQLLSVCDCNFVRGEDSFMRAQWVARPMVWQIYPQDEGVHWRKLSAFLDLYCDGLDADVAVALRTFWDAWNRGADAGAAWRDFWRHHLALERHAERWVDRLATRRDFVSALVDFCNDRLT